MASSTNYARPKDFLELIVEVADTEPQLFGWCAGFENSEWRYNQLAKHLLEWLPEFALRFDEWSDISHSDAVRLVGKAAKAIYATKNADGRGEAGEILLHAMIRQRFDSFPAISKIFFKDAENEVVKGFDAVHVVGAPGNRELWLGEVKFYEDCPTAISHVVKELEIHTADDYLRSEFTAICNKLDTSWSECQDLKDFLDKNESLDKIFKRLCIPVLLTYDSKVTGSFTESSKEYREKIEAELRKYWKSFASKDLPKTVVIKLFLLPLSTKKELQKAFDSALKACQSIY